MTTSNYDESPPFPPMHILGCGSIGLLYASAIHNTYYKQRRNDNKQPPVTLLMRPHHKPRLIQQDTNDLFASITIQRGTTIRRCEIPVEIISNSEHNSPIKCVLLCTKANDAVAAIESIWHRLNQSPSFGAAFRGSQVGVLKLYKINCIGPNFKTKQI